MIPVQSGIAVVVHLVINIVAFTYKKLIRGLAIAPSILVILVVLSIASFGAIVMARTAIQSSSSNIVFVKELISRCQSIKREFSERMVILRVDGVQSTTSGKVAKRIIDEAIDSGIPVSAGIVPKNIDEDSELTRWLQDRSCNIEMAVNGWDAIGYGEFAHLNNEEALMRLQAGKAQLSSLVGHDIVTFIPPQNVISDQAVLAAKQAGFSIISRSGNGYVDTSAPIYNSLGNNGFSYESVMTECELRFQEGNVCVIALHPSHVTTDGALDKVKYENVLEVINMLHDSSVTFITFDQLIIQ